jgi:hypothetical protein
MAARKARAWSMMRSARSDETSGWSLEMRSVGRPNNSSEMSLPKSSGHPSTPGAALLNLVVDDLDKALSDLAGRGITAGAIQPGFQNVRFAAIHDPMAGSR